MRLTAALTALNALMLAVTSAAAVVAVVHSNAGLAAWFAFWAGGNLGCVLWGIDVHQTTR